MDSLALVEVSHWGALETDRRDTPDSLQSHLGPVMSLSKVELVS